MSHFGRGVRGFIKQRISRRSADGSTGWFNRRNHLIHFMFAFISSSSFSTTSPSTSPSTSSSTSSSCCSSRKRRCNERSWRRISRGSSRRTSRRDGQLRRRHSSRSIVIIRNDSELTVVVGVAVAVVGGGDVGVAVVVAGDAVAAIHRRSRIRSNRRRRIDLNQLDKA